MSLEALVDDLSEFLLSAKEVYLESVRIFRSVYKAEILRDALVEDESSDSGLNEALACSFN